MGLLPDNYKDATTIRKEQFKKDPRYIEPGDLPDGGVLDFRPCGTHSTGHVIAGYQYFSTVMKRTRRFPTFPQDYLEDIGLSFEARKMGTQEKDTPEYFLSMCCLERENNAFAIVTFPKVKLRGQVEAVLAMPDYQVEDGAMAPFYLSIRRTGTGKNTEYSVIPTLKPPTVAEKKRWEEVKGGIWLPALFEGADPFAGPPANARPVGLPPMAEDELGANTEVLAGDAPAW